MNVPPIVAVGTPPVSKLTAYVAAQCREARQIALQEVLMALVAEHNKRAPGRIGLEKAMKIVRNMEMKQ